MQLQQYKNSLICLNKIPHSMVKNLPSKPNKLNKQSWHLTCLFRGVSCDKVTNDPSQKATNSAL